MSNDNSFANISLHVGAAWMVHTCKYDAHTPILDISAGQTSLMISPENRDATENAVQFARALVREAQGFAAEVERLYAEQAKASVAELPGRAA